MYELYFFGRKKPPDLNGSNICCDRVTEDREEIMTNCYVYSQYNLFAHSCLKLLVIKSTVYCSAHFILFFFYIPYILLCYI